MKKLIVCFTLLLLSAGLFGQVNKPAAVDLGLSVKWADRNVGATKVEDYGDLIAWGETIPKEDYSWMSYKWCEIWYSLGEYCYFFTKYWPGKVAFRKGGYWDWKGSAALLDLSTLRPVDDAATAAYGDDWRTPTVGEWRELLENCDFTVVEMSGVYGHKVTSQINGNSIFLPFTGQGQGTVGAFLNFPDGYYKYGNGNIRGERGYYWSSDLYQNSNYDTKKSKNSEAPNRSAYYFRIDDFGEYVISNMNRYYGQGVRAVSDK